MIATSTFNGLRIQVLSAQANPIKINLNTIGAKSDAVLVYACSNEALLDVARALLSRQDANVLIHAKDKYGYTPLFMASMSGNAEVAKLLIEKGVDLNAKNKCGYTPLDWASNGVHDEVTELLVENGAELTS